MLQEQACVRGLVGEIFLEEDGELTETYKGILRVLAVGNVSKDIASFLGKNSSDIKSFLANLIEMGLRHKICIPELSFDSKSFEKAYKDKLPRYFEDFVRDALAEKYEEEEELMFSRGGCGDNCQR